MVFTSIVNFVRSKGPDEFWRKRRVFKLTAKYYGRSRNCYSLAIRGLHHALIYATRGRRQKKLDRKELWTTRINAACEEMGTDEKMLMESLARCNIALNFKTVADLAIWEPRTFKCVVNLSKAKQFQMNQKGLNSLGEVPDNVITRGML